MVQRVKVITTVATTIMIMWLAVGGNALRLKRPKRYRGMDLNATDVSMLSSLHQYKMTEQDCRQLKALGVFEKDVIVTVNVKPGDTLLLPCHYCGVYYLQEKVWSKAEFNWFNIWEWNFKFFDPTYAMKNLKRPWKIFVKIFLKKMKQRGVYEVLQ